MTDARRGAPRRSRVPEEGIVPEGRPAGEPECLESKPQERVRSAKPPPRSDTVVAAPPETGRDKAAIPGDLGNRVGSDVVLDALARALEGATAAGRWDVVSQLARELEARRLAGAGVLVLDAVRRRRQ
jgi:hypothetical protein